MLEAKDPPEGRLEDVGESIVVTIPLGIGYYVADRERFLVKDEARADHQIDHPVPAESRPCAPQQQRITPVTFNGMTQWKVSLPKWTSLPRRQWKRPQKEYLTLDSHLQKGH